MDHNGLFMYIEISLRHHNQYAPVIFKLDSGHSHIRSYLQIFKLNTT